MCVDGRVLPLTKLETALVYDALR
ncbi:MAG: hypothetical protein JWN44_4766, partial [Myxococcales bacterium]|nr:hypothetical protein [Myxococcales bacterium]